MLRSDHNSCIPGSFIGRKLHCLGDRPRQSLHYVELDVFFVFHILVCVTCEDMLITKCANVGSFYYLSMLKHFEDWSCGNDAASQQF